MLPELIRLCRQSVTLERRLGLDGYGEATFAAPVAYRVRVSGQRRLVANPQGEAVVSTQRVYFVENPPIGPHDRLTLSTTDAGSTESFARQPTILSITRVLDDLGRPHTQVDLSPWRTG